METANRRNGNALGESDCGRKRDKLSSYFTEVYLVSHLARRMFQIYECPNFAPRRPSAIIALRLPRGANNCVAMIARQSRVIAELRSFVAPRRVALARFIERSSTILAIFHQDGRGGMDAIARSASSDKLDIALFGSSSSKDDVEDQP